MTKLLSVLDIFEIMLPGGIVGLIAGDATQKLSQGQRAAAARTS